MKKNPKRKKHARAARWCGWCYLAALLWPLLLPAILKPGLPPLVLVLSMAPGCAAGLYGWSLLTELLELPESQRPHYCRILEWRRLRDLPFLYFFALLALFLL